MFVSIRMLPHGSQPAVLIADKIPDYRQIYNYVFQEIDKTFEFVQHV